MNINWQKELFFSSNEREDEILISSPRKQTALTSMFSSKFLEQETLSCTVTYSCNSAKLSRTNPWLQSQWNYVSSLVCQESPLWLLTNWLARWQRLKCPLQGFASEVIIKTGSFDASLSLAPSTCRPQQSPRTFVTPRTLCYVIGAVQRTSYKRRTQSK